MIKNFKQNYLLIDTNVIIYSAKYPEQFRVFFDELFSEPTLKCYNDVIRYEFLRGSDSPQDLKEKREYLDYLFGNQHVQIRDMLMLHIDSETYEDARRISNLYYFYNQLPKHQRKIIPPIPIDKITFTDLILTGQLKQQHNSLALATTNIDDFPTLVLDRRFVRAIDIGHHIITIAIYTFSEEKYAHILDSFTKSKQHQ